MTTRTIVGAHVPFSTSTRPELMRGHSPELPEASVVMATGASGGSPSGKGLTDTIRAVVRDEVLDRKRAKDKLYGQPRIFNDLLSSQPLCFNLFGELQQDLPLASRALRRLTQGRIERVDTIGFEHSPGRGDPKYTGDRSAFDVFVEYFSPTGEKCFAGIEVKYHEDLTDQPAEHDARYDEIAAFMGCFNPAEFERLKEKPLQQVWRDHLLAGSMLQARDRSKLWSPSQERFYS